MKSIHFNAIELVFCDDNGDKDQGFGPQKMRERIVTVT